MQSSRWPPSSLQRSHVPQPTQVCCISLSLSLPFPLPFPLSHSLSLSLYCVSSLCFVIVSIVLCPVDRLTHLVMLPLPDGCVLHACYNGELSLITHFQYKSHIMVSLYMYNVHAGSELCQWSVKDITTSGSYQAKKEKVFTTPSTISWYMCMCIYICRLFCE